MSLKETYIDLQQKTLSVEDQLKLLQLEIETLEKKIRLIEQRPNFLDADVEPLYELLWHSRINYKKQQTELNTLLLQLDQLQHILQEMNPSCLT